MCLYKGQNLCLSPYRKNIQNMYIYRIRILELRKKRRGNPYNELLVIWGGGVQQPHSGLGSHTAEASRSHTDTPHSAGFFWTSDQLVADTST